MPALPHSPVGYHFQRGNPEDQPSRPRTSISRIRSQTATRRTPRSLQPAPRPTRRGAVGSQRRPREKRRPETTPTRGSAVSTQGTLKPGRLGPRPAPAALGFCGPVRTRPPARSAPPPASRARAARNTKSTTCRTAVQRRQLVAHVGLGDARRPHRTRLPQPRQGAGVRRRWAASSSRKAVGFGWPGDRLLDALDPFRRGSASGCATRPAAELPELQHPLLPATSPEGDDAYGSH